jgi:hypothetical protein
MRAIARHIIEKGRIAVNAGPIAGLIFFPRLPDRFALSCTRRGVGCEFGPASGRLPDRDPLWRR